MTWIVPATALAEDAATKEEDKPFQQGKVRISIIGGWSSGSDHDYLILGLGAGYYIARGLEVGLDFEAWLGSGPDQYRLSPQMRYVLLLDGPLKPYGGILYRHAFIPSLDDVNSLGLRVGAFYRGGRRSYVGFGIVHESLLDCDRTVYSSCSSTYPEVVVSLKF